MPPSRPSSPRPSGSRSSSVRPSGAALDPYGIYGARTATRLRDSQRRRRSQNLIAFFIFASLLAAVITSWKVRRVDTDKPQNWRELGLPVSVPPVWIAPSGSDAGVLLIAGEDGRLLKTSDVSGAGASGELTTEATQNTVLLETDFPLRAPLIFKETAFVPCEDGVLYAVSWKKRKMLWRQRFDAALTAQPALISVNKKPVVIAGSDAGLLLAMDAASGRILWRSRLPAPIGNGMAIAKNLPNAPGQKVSTRILVPLLGGAAMRGGLWCLDGASGKVLWRFPKDGRIEATQLSAPVADVGSGKVYGANDSGAVYCLDLQTGQYNSKGQPGWKSFIKPLEDHDQNQATLLRAAPVLTGAIAGNEEERLILGGNDGGVRCVSAQNGKLLWQTDVEASVSALMPVRYTDGRELILVCNRNGELALLQSENGSILRKFSNRGDRFVGATVSEKAIYGVTNKGTLLQFALSK